MLVDRNYPSYACGKPVIEVASTSILEVAEAILGVFPIDTFITHPSERMEVDQDPNKTTPVQDALLEQVRAAHQPSLTFGVIPRMDVMNEPNQRLRSCALSRQPLIAFSFCTKESLFKTPHSPAKYSQPDQASPPSAR